MERLERKEAAQIRVEVILRDGSTAAAYRLAPPWEHCGDSTGGGAAAASTETTASVAAPAVPAQAALMVARLVLTIVSAGNTSSISLVPRGQDGEAGEAHGSSSMSIQIYPTENRAVMRVFDIAGYQKKWCSTGLYTMCVEHSFHAVSSELVFGKDARVFDVTRCEELQFPPFKLNFAMDFNVLKKLGDGTEGKVSRCSCKFTEYRCAIKEVIPSNLMITSTSSEPSDVSILADLSHPNIVKLHLAWNEKGRDYFGCPADITFRSMKLCARTLSTYLKRTSKFELATANHIFRQIVMGLEHAHAHYVVHHDLKPANILMDDDLTIKICDFGTAERKKSPNSKLNPGVIGSLPYCAPEVTNGHTQHDEKGLCFELFIPSAASRQRKVQEFSRVLMKAMSSWEPWNDFDLNAALDGTGLLDEWAGDFSLLKLMINPNDAKRSSATEILARLPGTNTSDDLKRN